MNYDEYESERNTGRRVRRSAPDEYPVRKQRRSAPDDRTGRKQRRFAPDDYPRKKIRRSTADDYDDYSEKRIRRSVPDDYSERRQRHTDSDEYQEERRRPSRSARYGENRSARTGKKSGMYSGVRSRRYADDYSEEFDDIYDDDYVEDYDDRTDEYGDDYDDRTDGYGDDYDDGYGDDYDDNYDDYEEEGTLANKGHRKKPSKKKNIVKVILGLILVFAVFIVGKNIIQGNNWTVAVFGVDARDGELEEGTRSDVIMIVNVNKRSGDVKLVSVFRDTYLKIDDDGNYNKINAAYERGGHEQAVKALEENLDIKIDDYITFSWSAVAKGINALGGIDLEISDAEFSYINAFITETVNSTGIGSVQLKSAGMNHLDGVQAVAYGRLRLMDTDFNRTARQRKVIGLAVEKAKAADFDTLKNAALAVLPEVSTSIGIDDLLPLIRNIDKYNIGDSTGFPFSRQTMDIGKLDCVVPTTLESNVVTLHQILFGEENYNPSSKVKSISDHIGEVTGLTDAGENAPEAGTGGGIVHKDTGSNTPAATEAPQTEAPTESETAESESESTDESTEESGEGSENESESTENSENEDDSRDESKQDGEEDEADEPESESQSRPHTRPTETAKEPETTGPREPVSPETSGSQNDGGAAVITPDGPRPIESQSGPGASGHVEGPMGGPGV